MILYCYELFDKRKDILAAWQNKFQYILVDEFQDINQLQYDIVKLLAKPQDNLFIVGDDDQSEFHKGLSRGRDGDTGCELPM